MTKSRLAHLSVMSHFPQTAVASKQHCQGDRAVARLTTDKFVGPYLVHCHKLEHEDNGMMGFLKIQGECGDVWKDAERFDPTCFREEAPDFTYTLVGV